MKNNKQLFLNIVFGVVCFTIPVYFVPKIEPAIKWWHIALILGGVVVFTLISEYRKR